MKILLCLIILLGCTSSPIPPATKKEFFLGREGNPIYQAEVPLHWKRIETTGDLSDTRIPICSYEMDGGHLTIHTFPEQRIPPEAQIQRWKKQVEECEVIPFANGGFGGFRLESDQMLAYALQLSPLLYRALPPSELRADYTLKFVGSLSENREDVDAFALSFEWIQPISYETL